MLSGTPLLPSSSELDQSHVCVVGGGLVGEGEGGTEGHVPTLSVNLESDSNHNGDTVHVIIDLEVVALGSIVGHEESVADVNGVSDTVVCRGRGLWSKELTVSAPAITALHTTSHMYTSEGSEEWAKHKLSRESRSYC